MKAIEKYLSGFHSSYLVFDQSKAVSLYKIRDPFAHKGNFGHALLLAGSYGKIGAAVLAAKACLAAGSGLLTSWLPACGYEIMQIALPEAMVRTDENEFHLTTFPSDLDIFQVAGLGPGIGTHEETAYMVERFLTSFRKPLVLDADALNIISHKPEMMSRLHPFTILTPHPKEFDRLFGPSSDDLARIELAKKMSIHHRIIIVLKGHFTAVLTPDGHVSINSSGNAGMAKGGSGDALTGIITSLLAQSYAPAAAAMLGVYLHGYAGDLSAGLFSEEAMLASDLIECIGKTFLEWKKELGSEAR
jgi:ADP-dependent NAD(P)H-hydrate dehydratase / NAD(P)H-hydrate epimerase